MGNLYVEPDYMEYIFKTCIDMCKKEHKILFKLSMEEYDITTDLDILFDIDPNRKDETFKISSVWEDIEFNVSFKDHCDNRFDGKIRVSQFNEEINIVFELTNLISYAMYSPFDLDKSDVSDFRNECDEWFDNRFNIVLNIPIGVFTERLHWYVLQNS